MSLKNERQKVCCIVFFLTYVMSHFTKELNKAEAKHVLVHRDWSDVIHDHQAMMMAGDIVEAHDGPTSFRRGIQHDS